MIQPSIYLIDSLSKLPGKFVCYAILAALLQLPNETPKLKIPDDFKVTATFRAGHNLLKGVSSWTITIDHTGKAVQKYYVLPSEDPEKIGGMKEKTIQLTEEDLQELLFIIENTNFMHLKAKYGKAITPPTGKVIEVRMNDKTHKVVQNLDPYLNQAERKDVAAFQKFWLKLVEKVPSPNHNPDFEDTLTDE